MLITPYQISRCWGFNPKEILHIGAHEAEERSLYARCGWGMQATIWVEALPDLAQLLASQVTSGDQEVVVQALAWEVSGERIDFFRSSNGQSSSALIMKEHKEEYPEIVVVGGISLVSSALDDLETIQSLPSVGLVNIDVQGAELRVLRGMQATLTRTQAVYCEFNTRELYEGCAQLVELDDFLGVRDFVRVDWRDTGRGWGDALWLRQEIVPSFVVGRRSIRRVWTMLSTIKRKCLKFGRLIRSVD